MPTAKQKQVEEFVHKAMCLASDLAVHAVNGSDAGIRTTLNVLNDHLESHAQQQAAVVGALVEACQAHIDQSLPFVERQRLTSYALALVKEAK